MELLLLLTAFFASLTGTAAGQQLRVPDVAVVQAARAAQAAAQPAQRALPAVAVQPFLRPDRVAFPRLADAPLPGIRPAFERRRE